MFLIIFAVVVLLGCQISMELLHHLSSILETGTFGTQALNRKTHHCRVTKNCLSVNHFLLVGFFLICEPQIQWIWVWIFIRPETELKNSAV